MIKQKKLCVAERELDMKQNDMKQKYTSSSSTYLYNFGQIISFRWAC